MSDKIFITDGSGNPKGAIFYDAASDEIRIASYDDTPVIDGYVSVSSAGLTGSSIALDTGAIASGTWTPTATIVSNLDSVTPNQGHYIRVGNVVHCGVRVVYDATAASSVEFRLSLPIASNFTANGDATGVGVSDILTIARVREEVVNDEVSVNITNTATVATGVHLLFSYKVK